MIHVLAQIGTDGSKAWFDNLKLFLDILVGCIALSVYFQNRNQRKRTNTGNTARDVRDAEELQSVRQDFALLRESVNKLREDMAGMRATQKLNSSTLHRLEEKFSRYFDRER